MSENPPRGVLAVYDRAEFSPGLALDFIGRSNIWIDNDYTDGVVQLGRFLILEALRRTAPGQIGVTVFDSKLSGIFAPFSELSAGDARLLTMLGSEAALRDHLLHVRHRVQDVQNKMKGQFASLLEYREALGKPEDGFNLIVLSIDAFTLDKETRAALSLLLEVGPPAGFSFLVISTTTDAPVSLKAKCAVVTVEDGTVRCGARMAGFVAPEPTGIAQWCKRLAAAPDTGADDSLADRDVLGFLELHAGVPTWEVSSRDGLTFTVGRWGQEDVLVTVGDRKNQRHNVLITGAVGQGKSNLISVIVHSLCWRYSPKELSLYLLDFKEGVSLQPYANIGREEYLPHAKALGLECDEGFGLAVLEHLFGEYKRRLRLFKEAGVRDLPEYRRLLPEAELPRIVAIIDEFQLMFGPDEAQSRQIADLLEKSVRLYRAAGIHFILASQSLASYALLGKASVIFSQMPIRIAHKNSVAESQLTLGQDNPEAAYLRPKEAIVNLDYGEIGQNRRTTIAFADEAVLEPLRHDWWAQAKDVTAPPRVFDGQQRATPADVTQAIAGLAGNAWPTVPLGLSTTLTTSLVSVRLGNDNGKNIAIFGDAADPDQHPGIGIMEAIMWAVAFCRPRPTLFVADFLDPAVSEANGLGGFLDRLGQVGADVERIAPAQFTEFAADTAEALADGGPPRFVFGIGLDRWDWNPSFDAYADPPLKKLVRLGPTRGVHFIGWWNKATDFAGQVASSQFESTAAFNTRVFLRVPAATVRDLGTPDLLRWVAPENRALVVDEAEFGAPVTFIPFSPMAADQLDQIRGREG